MELDQQLPELEPELERVSGQLTVTRTEQKHQKANVAV